MLMFLLPVLPAIPKSQPTTTNIPWPLYHCKVLALRRPDGLHFTISDTGWAKAMWG